MDAARARDAPPRYDEAPGGVLLLQPRHVLAHERVDLGQRPDVGEEQDEHGRATVSHPPAASDRQHQDEPDDGKPTRRRWRPPRNRPSRARGSGSTRTARATASRWSRGSCRSSSSRRACSCTARPRLAWRSCSRGWRSIASAGRTRASGARRPIWTRRRRSGPVRARTRPRSGERAGLGPHPLFREAVMVRPALAIGRDDGHGDAELLDLLGQAVAVPVRVVLGRRGEQDLVAGALRTSPPIVAAASSPQSTSSPAGRGRRAAQAGAPPRVSSRERQDGAREAP